VRHPSANEASRKHKFVMSSRLASMYSATGHSIGAAMLAPSANEVVTTATLLTSDRPANVLGILEATVDHSWGAIL